jgi:hypothetical protein
VFVAGLPFPVVLSDSLLPGDPRTTPTTRIQEEA